MLKAWLADDNIDIISPQMYSSGEETVPVYEPTWSCFNITSDDKRAKGNGASNCTWDLYQDAKPTIVPAIVGDEQLPNITRFFKSVNVPTQGFFQWRQQHKDGTSFTASKQQVYAGSLAVRGMHVQLDAPWGGEHRGGRRQSA